MNEWEIDYEALSKQIAEEIAWEYERMMREMSERTHDTLPLRTSLQS